MTIARPGSKRLLDAAAGVTEHGAPQMSNRFRNISKSALVPTVFAGLISGLLAVISAASFAALIVVTELEAFLSSAIAITLVAAVINSAIVALFSSYPGAVAIPRDRIAPILAIMAASIVETRDRRQRSGEVSHRHGVDCRGLALAVLVAGMDLVALVPRTIFGGLLLFLGLSFLVAWVIDGYRRLAIGDYFVVILILLVVVTLGYVQGVLVGLLAAICLFVLRYSRVDVVRARSNITHRHSNVDRPNRHRLLLNEVGEQIPVMQLQE